MPTREQIQALADHIAREFHPERIILFGSHARGTPGPDSDVDMLVIVEHTGRNRAKAFEIRQRVEPGYAFDLLVRTPKQVNEHLAARDLFMTDILGEGRVLYETKHASVG